MAVLLVLAASSAGRADDDADLRRRIRSAGLVPYWSFRPPARFSYPDVAGGPPITLEALRGKVGLVNLWATWHAPCAAEMASLQALHDQFHAQGLVVIGINILDPSSPATVAAWLRERHLRYPNARTPGAGPSFPSRHGIPQTFLIDRRGRLLANKPGEGDWTGAPVKALIAHLLNAP